MAAEWRDVQLDQVASYLNRGSAPAYTDQGGILVLNQRCIREQRLFLEHARRTDIARKRVSDDRLLRPFDILVNSTGVGTLGRVAQVLQLPERATVDSHVTIVRPASDVDARFLGYALRHRQPDIEALGEGSTGQTELARARLGALRLRIPRLPVQRAIAHILGTLDDKIELNRRMNETLEEMARALFKSWFVDFDPVRAKAEGREPSGMDAETAKLFPSEFEMTEHGRVPKGWRVVPLDEIADFRNGLALQRFRPITDEARLPVVKIAQLRTGNADSGEWARDDIDPACIIDDGDVIFSWSGSLLVVLWCGGRAALNQHLFRVTSRQYPKWFYLHWLLHHLPEFQRIAADKATTMGHIQRHHLSGARCVIPSGDVLDRMSSRFETLLKKRNLVELESRSLTTIRDTLLPCLLSGEVSLRDAESVAERFA